MKIKVDDFAVEITGSLSEYYANVVHETEQYAKAAAYECRNILRKTSPKRTDSYAPDWQVKRGKARQNALYIVYNKTHYMLTHLLEFGHAKTNGGRVRAIPHIQPAAEKAANTYFANLVKALGGVGFK